MSTESSRAVAECGLASVYLQRCLLGLGCCATAKVSASRSDAVWARKASGQLDSVCQQAAAQHIHVMG
jgi:hypothetical protein